MNTNDERDKITAQWITSLAISVVCCAALFLIFAGYIMDVHSKIIDTSIRLEVLQERQNHLVAELDALRRPIPVTMIAPAGQNAAGNVQQGPQAPQNASTPASPPAPVGNVSVPDVSVPEIAPVAAPPAPPSADVHLAPPAVVPPAPPVAVPSIAPAPAKAPAAKP